MDNKGSAKVKSSVSAIKVHPATKVAIAELRKKYGNGHRSRPSDSVKQHFIPDL